VNVRSVGAAVTLGLFVFFTWSQAAFAFPLGSGTFGAAIFGDSDGDLVEDSLDAFPLDARGHSDTDSDGVPDGWERANGLDPNNQFDAEFDPDRDGFTNTEEFANATDPSISDGNAQIVTIAAPDSMARGTNALVSLIYDASDNNSDLTGLGIRVHINSQIIGSVSFDNVLSRNLIGVDTSFSVDSFDYDNEGSTDVFVTLAWAAASSPSWPGTLPIKLADMTLTLNEQSYYGETSVPLRVTASSTATGYRLSADPATSALTDSSFDIDDDGRIEALTDGLLLMRSMFDFSGEQLVAGAVASEGTRKTAEEIQAFIASLAGKMDIDADGKVEALTDGLLIVRFLFDFRRESLIAGAVATDATRKTSEEIEEYLESILPALN